MDCRISVTKASDKPYLVKSEEFMRYVDQDDLACRESDIVQNVYLADWFYYASGQRYFYLPTFFLDGGRPFFINGRHRTILLSRYLDLLPMAFAQIPLTQMGPDSQSVLERLVYRELMEGELIDLPDLPIVDAIPPLSKKE